MRKVKIQQETHKCRMCLETAMSYDQHPDCEGCERTGIWIDTVSSFWGTYAVVQFENGKVEKIGLYRITVIES